MSTQNFFSSIRRLTLLRQGARISLDRTIADALSYSFRLRNSSDAGEIAVIVSEPVASAPDVEHEDQAAYREQNLQGLVNRSQLAGCDRGCALSIRTVPGPYTEYASIVSSSSICPSKRITAGRHYPLRSLPGGIRETISRSSKCKAWDVSLPMPGQRFRTCPKTPHPQPLSPRAGRCGAVFG